MRNFIPLIFTACLAQASTAIDPSLKVLLNGSNASISWNAAISGSADLQQSADLLSWTTIDANNNTGSFFHTVGNATRGFYKLRVPGIFAQAPGLAGFSDTGISINDGVTYDRTPTLVGRVLGAVSHVRISMNGQPGAVVAVVGGIWTYAVTAEAPLTAGIHTFTVTPVDDSEFAGDLSSPLLVSIISTPLATPTLGIENLSDSGVKGDGLTTEAEPFFSGTTTPGVQVKINIDGVPVGIAQSDANTGAWSFKSPRLADGFHEVSAVSTDQAGLASAPKDLTVKIFGSRMVMLDASSGGTVELTAAHLLGRNSQGFIVTQVLSGTLEKWDSASNAWVLIPPEALGTTLDNAPSIRIVLFTDIVRWTPPLGAVGTNFVFAISPVDTAGGPTAPTPQAGTVPGKVVDSVIGGYKESLGTTILWKDPVEGGGGGSTRYSIEVTREDGKTLLYNVPRTVHSIPIVEGGAVIRSRIWGATETGAGEARSFDVIERAESLNRLSYTIKSAASFIDLGTKARAQLANSLTPSQFTTSLPLGGSHSDLAYLEMQAVPDAIEAEQGLPAGTPLIISSETSKLTPTQLADLKANPIYASYLFPGTMNGDVQPDQLRAHLQAGEALRFAGNVDASVRVGATIVVEKAQNLGDGSLGPWFQEARIPIGADGSYSHKYLVPYGLNSVRVRLEYPTQPAAASVGATSSTSAPISTPIDLSTYFNAFGITTPPWQVGNSQGFDGNGNYYNSDYNVDTAGTQNDPVAGTPIIYNGISFPIGPVPTNANQVGGTEGVQNFVRATGQTIQVSVDADKSDYLYLAGAASNGNHLSQTITLNFTDGTTEKWTQSFHDWASEGPPQPSNPPWPPTYTTAPGANTKLSVRVATTASLQNTNPSPTPETFSGLQTIDGVALAEGDRVLVKNQTDEQYNGIYVASAGTWIRAKDALTPEQQWNESMSILSGTTNGGKCFWENTSPFAISVLQTEAAELHQQIEYRERELLRIELENPRYAEQLEQEIAGYVRQLLALEPKLAKLIAMEYPITFVEITPPVSTPRPFAGELNLKTEPERINQLGDLAATPAHIFAYCRNLHGKQLASITLPNNSDIGILSAVVSKAPVIALDEGFASVVLATTNFTGIDVVALTISNESNLGAGGGPLTFFFADQPVKGSVATATTPATYATKPVTVPMGQQTTIAYIAPDSSSQMTFTVQKADDTCVGSDCSTYLPDWNDGTSGSSNWAANISPSLNSQIQAGQQWTMTIQNAGLGYTGTLSSPSGKGLPTAGAQFKLMTQNEINDQPHWATELETILGEATVIVGLTIATGGTADVAVITEVAVDTVAVETVTVTAEVTAEVAEQIIVLEEEFVVDDESELTNFLDDSSLKGSFQGSIVEPGDIYRENKLWYNEQFRGNMKPYWDSAWGYD
jgi:Bacterial Ig-like domain